MRCPGTMLVMVMLVVGACGRDEVAPGEDSAEAGDSAAESDTVTDVDGNSYPAVALGSQLWMGANLMTTHLRDGTPLRAHVDGERWFGEGPAWQWGDTSDLNGVFDESLPPDFYGAAYNEDALLTGQLCPAGWRLPSVGDFEQLEAFIAGEGLAVSVTEALKTVDGWVSDPGGGVDLYGFGGQACGYVAATGTATGAGVIGTFASREASSTERMTASLYDQPGLSYAPNAVQLGAFVRCIME